MIKYLRDIIRNFIEIYLFDISTSEVHCLKYEKIHQDIRNTFMNNGILLSMEAYLVPNEGNIWTLRDTRNIYSIRNFNNSASVYIQKNGFIPSAIRTSVLNYYFIKNNLYRYILDNISFLKYYYRKNIIDKPDSKMVNIGSGKWYAKNWKVLDFSGSWYAYPKYFIDYEYNLMSLKRLPFSDNSVNLFYSEHVFEHIPDEYCLYVFKEIHRSLVSGGGFRVVVPDADLIYNNFFIENLQFFEKWIKKDNATLTEAFLILTAHPRIPINDADIKNNMLKMEKEEFLNYYSNNLEYDYRRAGEHINWFNIVKLKNMLNDAGFKTINRTKPQESIFKEIRGDRFDTRGWYSLHVDAIKD